MNEPKMNQMKGRVRYNTESARLIADDGINTFLYRNPSGRYFLVIRSQWKGEDLLPLEREEAAVAYKNLKDAIGGKHIEFEQAFPDVDIEDDGEEVRLSPIRLGTGEVGRKRRAALEAIAMRSGHEWNGRGSLGKLLIALADGDEKLMETPF